MTDANEELIVVPMSFLVKSGLFENKASIISLTFEHNSVCIKYDEEDNQLLVTTQGWRSQEWSIGISHHHLEHGARSYFDIDNNHGSQLYFIVYRGILHSGKSFMADPSGLSIMEKKKLVKLARLRSGFFVPPGTGSVKIRRLAARASAELTLEEFDKLPKETIAAFQENRTLGQLRYNDHNPANERSSKYAVLEAPEPNPWAGAFFSQSTPTELRRMHPAGGPPIEINPRPIATCCWLDIADLNRAGTLKRGHVSSLKFAWPLNYTDNKDITLFSDLRDKTFPVLLFEILNWDADEAVWQQVKLSQADNSRWYFLCPIDGRRCDTLYLRENRFGSWQAQKLYHPSQRG